MDFRCPFKGEQLDIIACLRVNKEISVLFFSQKITVEHRKKEMAAQLEDHVREAEEEGLAY